MINSILSHFISFNLVKPFQYADTAALCWILFPSDKHELLTYFDEPLFKLMLITFKIWSYIIIRNTLQFEINSSLAYIACALFSGNIICSIYKYIKNKY